MSKVTLFVVTMVVLAASAAIVGWSFFGSGNEPLAPKKVQPTSTSSKEAQSSLITDCTPPQVNASTLAFLTKDAVYGLGGKILFIKDAASGKRLVTDIKGKIPSFTIGPWTKVLLVKDREESVGSPDDVQVGQKVVISIYCNANKVWATSVVRIFTSATSSQEASTSSAR